MIVRRATVDDVGVVALLEEDVFAADAWSLESVTAELTGPQRHAFVACDAEDHLVGYAVGMQFDDVVDLHRIAVVPTARRTGVAQALLQAVQQAARADGARRMLLEVSDGNVAAVAFYAQAGFGEIDRRPHYYRDGSDALVLCTDLGDGNGS